MPKKNNLYFRFHVLVSGRIKKHIIRIFLFFCSRTLYSLLCWLLHLWLLIFYISNNFTWIFKDRKICFMLLLLRYWPQGILFTWQIPFSLPTKNASVLFLFSSLSLSPKTSDNWVAYLVYAVYLSVCKEIWIFLTILNITMLNKATKFFFCSS